MDENKDKDKSYMNNFNFDEYDFSQSNDDYESNINININVEEKIQDISYDYSLFVKKYIEDEGIYIFENFNYVDIMNFIEEIIEK
jgi:hypothetical protein